MKRRLKVWDLILKITKKPLKAVWMRTEAHSLRRAMKSFVGALITAATAIAKASSPFPVRYDASDISDGVTLLLLDPFELFHSFHRLPPPPLLLPLSWTNSKINKDENFEENWDLGGWNRGLRIHWIGIFWAWWGISTTALNHHHCCRHPFKTKKKGQNWASIDVRMRREKRRDERGF